MTASSSIQTYFLHDVVDPRWRAVAEVRALGIPVAQMGHAHVRSHACKTSKANRLRQCWHSSGDTETLMLLGILCLQSLPVWQWELEDRREYIYFFFFYHKSYLIKKVGIWAVRMCCGILHTARALLHPIKMKTNDIFILNVSTGQHFLILFKM